MEAPLPTQAEKFKDLLGECEPKNMSVGRLVAGPQATLQLPPRFLILSAQPKYLVLSGFSKGCTMGSVSLVPEQMNFPSPGSPDPSHSST